MQQENGGRQMHSGRSGFTLIELLIVVAIIGILVAIAVPNFQNARMRAKISRVIADFQSLRNALEMYRIDNEEFIHGWHTSYLQFIHLTTPIAYISTIPVDAFWDASRSMSPLTKSYSYAGCCIKPYMYHDIILYQIPGKLENFMLLSRGPDAWPSTNHTWYYPQIKHFAMYMSSNGLVSTGDIIFETNPNLNVFPLSGPAVDPDIP